MGLWGKGWEAETPHTWQVMVPSPQSLGEPEGTRRPRCVHGWGFHMQPPPRQSRQGTSIKNTLVTFIGACASYKSVGKRSQRSVLPAGQLEGQEQGLSGCLCSGRPRGNAWGQRGSPRPTALCSRVPAAQGPAASLSQQGGSLLGDGKGLLHLDGAAVSDGDILQGLVPAVCLGVLHLPHHVLGRAEV